ncbi:MAG TPA: ABC transporter permease [Terriglobales bacterium]
MSQRWIAWFRKLFQHAAVDHDLEAEINAHVQLMTDENAANGLGPEAARRQALLDLGGVQQVKEEVRAVSAGLWLEHLWQDVRYGARMLRRSPGFVATAALTLALGIGANTAMFSVIDGVLLNRPPFAEPSRVMVVYMKEPNGATNIFSTPNYLAWKRQNSPVTTMAAMAGGSLSLGSKDGVERILGYQASSEIFSVLGVTPALGRAFTADEDRPGAGNVVLLSDSLWRTRFHSDPSILGSKLDLDGQPYTVIGVMPPGFHIFPYTAEQYYRPLQLETQDAVASSRTVHWLLAMLRVEPESSQKASQSALDAIAARLRHDDPSGDAGFGLTLQTYQEFVTGNIRGPLLILMGSVGFVLLIACSNVANLLLARATSRRLEMSIRAAVGAQRSRVVRQLLTESVLLSLIGGALGLLMAFGALKVVLVLNPVYLPNLQAATINTTILVFTTLVCLCVGILFGIVPALVASRVDLSNALRETSRGAGRSGGKHRVALVILETALASVLLIGAGLSIKSLWKVSRVDPGFNPNGLLTFKIAPPGSAKDQPYVFFQRVLEAVRALPGVESAALGRNIPLSNVDPGVPVAVDGGAPQITDGQVVTRMRLVGPLYFHVFETTVLRGREFSESDTAASQPVAIVSQSLAQRYWPNQNPLGKTLKPNLPDAPWYTVIGVAADVRHLGLDTDIEPTAYYPYPQFPKSLTPLATKFTTVVIRSAQMSGLADAVRHAAAGVDNTVPIYDVQTVDQMLLDAGSLRRFDMSLFAAFAGLALILAAIGVYGVMAYSVAQRTREIGIRMALGATRQDVLRLVVGQGVKMAVAGVMAGAIGALALTRLMASQLYDVSATDVWTYAFVSVAVVGFILLASYLPSRRAMRVDPNQALRHE